MKKLFLIIIAVMVFACFTGCNNTKHGENQDNESNNPIVIKEENSTTDNSESSESYPIYQDKEENQIPELDGQEREIEIIIPDEEDDENN